MVTYKSISLIAASQKVLSALRLDPICNHCGQRTPVERLWFEECQHAMGPVDLICWECNAKLAKVGYSESDEMNFVSRRNERFFTRVWDDLFAPMR
jgi:hypothetical protein